MKKERITYKSGDILDKCVFLKDTSTVIKIGKTRKRYCRYAEFKCECGNIFETNIEWVKSGATQSCGCLTRRLSIARLPSPLKHGHAKAAYVTPEYRAWLGMKMRCKGTNKQDKKNYLDKGITVCDRWINSFENFIADMGYRPSDEHSLDRENSSKGYSPENCRWATVKEQNGNKSSNIMITYKDKTQCLMYWARDLGINYVTLTGRLGRDWSVEKCFTTPVRK